MKSDKLVSWGHQHYFRLLYKIKEKRENEKGKERENVKGRERENAVLKNVTMSDRVQSIKKRMYYRFKILQILYFLGKFREKL